MLPDDQLLRRYADDHDEDAFAELVRRHVDLVYSVALRHTAGDAYLAQDATQTVFTDLARKARFLSRRRSLAGWLHTSARYAAGNVTRGERRRRMREQEAVMMHENTTANEINWEQLQPLLDESVGQLNDRDRDAIVLRFFEGKSHREVGHLLGLTENVANKRIERALEKLRAHFARRGITVTAAFLVATIGATSVRAAPSGLSAKVSKAALMDVGFPSTGLLLGLLFMNTKTKLVTLTTVFALAAIIGFGLWWLTDATTPVPEKTAQAAVPAKLGAIQPPASTGKIYPPHAAPATIKTAADTVAAATPDPQTELKTMIADYTRLLRSGDWGEIYKTFTPPDQFKPADYQAEQENTRKEAAYFAETPGAQQSQQALREKVAQEWEAFGSQTPTFNEAGDEATFVLTRDFGNGGQKQIPTILVKVNGKWYIKN